MACTRCVKLDLTLVTDDLHFPEGPLAMADGSVIVVEMKRGTLTRVRTDGKHEIVAQLGQGPNGAAVGPDGAVYVCNNGGAWGWQEGELHLPGPPPAEYHGGSIQRVDLKTGRFTTLYSSCDGKPLNSPNDIVFDREGGFWFTCLGQSDGEVRRLGAVYYARVDGRKIVRWRSGLFSPNGIGLSPDERVVYMADCMKGQLLAFDLATPGEMRPPPSLAGGRVIGTLPGFQWLDSLAVEADGRICVATIWNGGITVFEPGGDYEHYPFPDPVTTNICFGGADLRDAWITCSSTGKLYRCRWPRPGLKLAFNT
jgi:gluconolactonase